MLSEQGIKRHRDKNSSANVDNVDADSFDTIVGCYIDEVSFPKYFYCSSGERYKVRKSSGIISSRIKSLLPLVVFLSSGRYECVCECITLLGGSFEVKFSEIFPNFYLSLAALRTKFGNLSFPNFPELVASLKKEVKHA